MKKPNNKTITPLNVWRFKKGTKISVLLNGRKDRVVISANQIIESADTWQFITSDGMSPEVIVRVAVLYKREIAGWILERSQTNRT